MNKLAMHYCVFCGDRIEDSALEENGSVCKCCYNRWQYENEEAGKCRFRPVMNVRSVSFLGLYNSESDNLVRRLVLSQKEQENHSAVSFVSAQLAKKLLHNGIAAQEDIFVTNVPRSREKVIKYGFDQSALVASQLAKLIKRQYIPCLNYIGSNIEQKKLNADQREENAKNAYSVDDKYLSDIAFKGCIIVDDIVTTGSSVSSCADLLIKNGVRFVDCAVTGKTVNDNKTQSV